MRRFEAVLAFEAAPIDELAARAIDKVHLPGVRDEAAVGASKEVFAFGASKEVFAFGASKEVFASSFLTPSMQMMLLHSLVCVWR